MKHRMKASDVFRQKQFVFAGKGSFKEAFPQIKSLTIRTEERGYGVYKDLNVQTYAIERPPSEYIDCSNPRCYNGGFSVGEILREMARERKTHWEGIRVCQGYEGSPKGRVRDRSCINHWNITVNLEYYPEEEIKKLAEKSKKQET